MTVSLTYPHLGIGLGLRKEHYQSILDEPPQIDWFEAITENYLVPGGKPLHFLEQVRARYSVVLHGVSLSVGGTDPLDWDYLRQVKALVERIEPAWISDHLCFTGAGGINAHDLLPLPYTGEAVRHVARRIRQVQDFLGRRILIENVSSYLSYRSSEMSEWAFLGAVAEEADCLILLDINNIYVSARNHGFDPLEYLAGVPAERVQQHHLAGHQDYGDHVIDTHDHPVPDPVWRLYEAAVQRFGPVSCMIERDADIPPLEVLMEEVERMREIAEGAQAAAHV
ncbi:MAG TPA: DUF692 domain-containing protein [Chromatiales bacterium]|nr:DUF692 domain-containing protein [Chromatiales bacterium]